MHDVNHLQRVPESEIALKSEWDQESNQVLVQMNPKTVQLSRNDVTNLPNDDCAKHVACLMTGHMRHVMLVRHLQGDTSAR